MCLRSWRIVLLLFLVDIEEGLTCERVGLVIDHSSHCSTLAGTQTEVLVFKHAIAGLEEKFSPDRSHVEALIRGTI